MLETLRNRVAEFIAPPKVEEKPVGTSGTWMAGDTPWDVDFNTDFDNGADAVAKYRKMLKTDTTVKNSIRSITDMIRQAGADIVPASEDPRDEQIAEFVRDNLFSNRHFTYNALITNICHFIEFGFVVMEKTFERRDGKIWWSGFHYRMPETISGWKLDDDGNLDRVVQQAFSSRTQKWETVEMGVENVFHLSYQQEGDNWFGESILRPAYRNWFYKDKLLRFHMIQSERWGAGIPMGVLKNAAEKASMISVLKKIRANEQAYVAMSEDDFEISILNGSNSGIDMLPMVSYHDQQINTNISRQIMNLGQSGVGSYSLGKTQADMFALGVNSLITKIEEALNYGNQRMDHIRQLVDLNFSNVKHYPQLHIDRIDLETASEALDGWQKAVASGLIKVTDQDEEAVRRRIGAPARDFDADEEDAETDEDDVTEQSSFTSFQESKFWRQPTDFEARVLDLEDMQSVLDHEQRVALTDTEHMRQRIVRDLINRGVQLANAAKDAKDLKARLDKVKPPSEKTLAQPVSQSGFRLFDYGRDSVKKEIGKQTASFGVNDPAAEDAKTARSSISPKAQLLMSNYLGKVFGTWKDAVFAMFTAGDINTNFLRERIEKVSTNQMKREATKALNDAHGLGRNTQITAQGAGTPLIRSEILDENTCEPCVDVDGREFVQGDDFWHQVSNGTYSQCRGGELCRGINVVVA